MGYVDSVKRKVWVETEDVCIRFGMFAYTYTRSSDSFYNIMRYVAWEYNVPIAELQEYAKTLTQTLFGRDLKDKAYFEISRERATAEGLKEQIKTITAKMEQFITQLCQKAQEIRDRQDLDGWLWRVAQYDPERGKFVPQQS